MSQLSLIQYNQYNTIASYLSVMHMIKSCYQVQPFVYPHILALIITKQSTGGD
jgi:hypothetical protein